MKNALLVTFIISSFIAPSITYAQTPREQLNQMVQQLQKNPSDNALRERIIKLALEIKPPTAIPPEAERFEGRAQYLFKNARSESDYLNSAREYIEAVDAAPWIPGYYYDLCTILEKANRSREALAACNLYLAGSPPGPEATKFEAGGEAAKSF